MESFQKFEQSSKYSSNTHAKGSALRFSQSIKSSITPQYKLHSTRVIRLSNSQNLMRNSYQALEEINEGVGRRIKANATNLSVKQRQIAKSTQMVAQQLALRTNQTVSLVSKIGGRACLFSGNLKIFLQHVSGYPKIIYIPFLLISSATYGFHSVKKSSIPYQEEAKQQEENPLADYQSLKKWVAARTTSAITDIVGSKEVKKQGLSYLERMFKNKQVHDSLIPLLKGGVKDDRFVQDSKKFGIAWITSNIQAQQVKSDLKGLMSETFVRDQRVINQSVDVLKYFVQHPQSKELTKQICQQACLRGEVLGAIGQQMSKAGYNVASSNEFRTEFSRQVTRIINQEEICGGLKSQLLYKPLANAFTFGLYSRIAGDEQSVDVYSNSTQALSY